MVRLKPSSRDDGLLLLSRKRGDLVLVEVLDPNFAIFHLDDLALLERRVGVAVEPRERVRAVGLLRCDARWARLAREFLPRLQGRECKYGKNKKRSRRPERAYGGRDGMDEDPVRAG